ncbi:MAG: hypothetical protein KatS3mg061_0197 [Dehalococcoidia bacterium]|nr:MAG: hypothetical protein KatS3mg061_0197 [Dehalococcoidia bacterium]
MSQLSASPSPIVAADRASSSVEAAADRRRAFLLFLLLWSVYLFTASGRFHSDDEMSVWAVAASLVGRGEVTIDQLAWNQDLSGGVGRTQPDGHVFSKYGLGGSLALAPLLALAQQLPWAGAVSLATVLNGPVTAATAALLFLSARRLGAPAGAAALAALTFGLATFAWVYARYLFGEPLVALGGLAGFFLLLRPTALPALLAGGALAGAALVRSASALTAPLLLPLLVRGQRPLLRLPLFGLPLLLAVAGIGLYNTWRFGNPLDSGYNPIEGFTAPWGEGIWGLLLSPGRGLVFYAPPALLALWGGPVLLRRQPVPALTALLVVLANLLLYGKWHAWHGGWGWGPRLLLPVLPFLFLLALPVFAWATQGGRWWRGTLARGMIAVLGLAGVAVNILGVVVDFNRPLRDLLAERPDLGAGVLFLTLNDVGRSPLVSHAQLLTREPPDLLWLSGGLHPLLALTAALVMVAAGRLLILGWTARPGWGVLAGFTVVAAGALALASSHVGYTVGRYSEVGRQLAEAAEVVRVEARPGDRLLAVGLGEGEPLANRLPLWLPWMQILPEAEPLQPLTRARLSWAVRGQRLWLLQRNPEPPGEDNAIEATLDQLAYKVIARRQGVVELTRYQVAEAPPLAPVTIEFGGRLRLSGWAARVVDRTLLLDLQWLAVRSPGARYVISLRLSDGSVRLQHDREPADGARPTDGWRTGESVHERLGLELPAALLPGRYRLELVVYPLGGGRPLPASNGEVAIVGEVVIPSQP